ncbi:GNAT family N-acetyltransferase [Planococcus sp. N028]|uniref:GNAT family N-acetyltransferase n=1 Tax=Planococcus shixiaomingii TaxID=3058393 RepID=A0ABT8N1A8_9BACL|nr:GNAT family N-acetyltransferase [Planococcus sp. N028]MDN7241681.1 GNAT family N-acetyltransferase [Planococcus sp. N028]
MHDVFFDQNFGRLQEGLGGGTCEVFKFHNHLGAIRHMFMKREIPIRINGETYYDLVTPAAYGGPVITGCARDYKWDLVYEFMLAFEEYCKENRIVSEYVRFHPVAANAADFSLCYETDYVCDTYGTNLKAFLDPVQEEFSQSSQQTIWRALEAGVEYRVTAKPESLENFANFYAQLVANGDADYGYFLECGKLLKEQLVVVEALYKEQVIGMSLNFRSNDVIHTHLSVTHPAFDYFSPAHIMHFGLALWGKENSVSLIHDGGWLVANSQTPDLSAFKKQFSKHTNFKLCTGRRIWDQEMYRKLCREKEIGYDAINFPAYRGVKKESCLN